MNMFCSNCGNELLVAARFCNKCGKPASGAVATQGTNSPPKPTNIPPPAPHASPSQQNLVVCFEGAVVLRGTYEVFIDGAKIAEGNLNSKLNARTTVAPGRHLVTTVIAGPLGLRRRNEFTVEVRRGVCEAELSYSNIWGKFSDKIKVRYIPT